VTCESLGDVTQSHGTHDANRSVGKVRHRACVREGGRWCPHVEGHQRQRPEAVFLAHVELFVLRDGITSESRGDVTCESLGDVTWSHGTHDFKRSVGKVRQNWMRKQHQEGQNRIVMSTRAFLLLWFRINRNQSSDRFSSTQASRMPARACVREGACWPPSPR